ncbi:MAG: DEAD/DEAH box helicase [Spirochaetaceae bacterium]|nr:DEAD/DEAH box helicase [Spirochaetaceae bacterium]
MSLSPTITTEGAEYKTSEPYTFPMGKLVGIRSDSEAAPPPELLLLEGLWSDGLVEEVGPGHWLVNWTHMLEVDASDARALGLPEPEDIRVSIQATGVPTSPRFAIEAVLRHDVYGVLNPKDRHGPAIRVTGGRFVLVTDAVWRLLTRVEDRPSEDATTEDRFEYIAGCRAAAEACRADLDAFLSRQDVTLADEVGFEITEDHGALVVEPTIGELRSERFVLGNGQSRRIASLDGPDESRRRIVLRRDIRDQVENLSRIGRLEGPSVPEFLCNPEAFLPPGVSLRDFSERVQGFKIRVYNSRPYIHVRERSRGWLEFDTGVMLDPVGPSDDDQLEKGKALSQEEYERLKEKAREIGDRWIKHGDDWIEIDVDSGDQFSRTAQALRERTDASGGVRASVVLDVISNIESLDFQIQLPELEGAYRPWHAELPTLTPPDSFAAELDSHQLIGFNWLAYLHDRGAGGLLADDMGLGKTAQVIAHLCALKEAGALKPSLVVVPKTLIRNWQIELKRFAPKLSDVVVHEGPGRRRSTDHLSKHEIVLTTYDTVRSDQVKLGTIDWRVVALDEAQFVKNPTAGRTSAVKALKCDQLIAMTGTPVENGLIEFWSIMDRVRPGLLGGWSDFRETFEKALSQADESDRAAIVEQLLSRLDPHYLRRKKDEVLTTLPPKERVENLVVDLSPQQRLMYRDALREAELGGRGAVLKAIGDLLRICAHPRTYRGDWESADAETLVAECPKLARTLDVLSEIRAKDEKALVFAEWKSTQRILQRAISARFDSWPEIVNGDVTDRRQEIVDAFCERTGFDVMILSPKVAGYGLNITAANHVIHYTRPWNPAVENQATDRVHRRGQTKPVYVYYPRIRGTVEERLAELLRDKEDLARDVLRPTSERTVSAEELLEGAALA